jgi:hypothetical protein
MSNFITFLIILMFSASCGQNSAPSSSSLQEAWDHNNVPENMGVISDVNYLDIATEGRLSGDRLPWSGDYWPTFSGGISFRWQLEPNRNYGFEHYRYSPLLPDQAAQLSQSHTDSLSPSEKYDLLVGDLNFSLTKREQANTLATAGEYGEVPRWFGLCHGWATAAYFEQVPTQNVTLQSRFQQNITFTPSDIKALVTKFYASAHARAVYIGARCEETPFERATRKLGGPPSCRDTNPGSFHLAISDYINNRNQSFVAEVDRGSEVWNHPVVGYSFNYRKHRKASRKRARKYNYAPGTTQTVQVELAMEYAVETNAGADSVIPATTTKNLSYELELNQYGQILGGTWKSDDHPDFLWHLTARPTSSNSGISYQIIRQLSIPNQTVLP